MRALEEKTLGGACQALNLDEAAATHLPSTSGAVVFEHKGLIYRVATSKLLIEQQQRERVLLPKLIGVLPVRTPEIIETGDDPVYMAYRKIPGRTPRRENLPKMSNAERLRLAGQIGEALAVLHDFDPGAPVQADYEAATFERALPSVVAALREGRFDDTFDPNQIKVAIEGVEEAIELWRKERENYRDKVLLHFDLSFKNLLVEEESEDLTAVLDFSGAWTADRHWDFRLIYQYWSEAVFRELKAAYYLNTADSTALEDEKIRFLGKIYLMMSLGDQMRKALDRRGSPPAASQ